MFDRVADIKVPTLTLVAVAIETVIEVTERKIPAALSVVLTVLAFTPVTVVVKAAPLGAVPTIVNTAVFILSAEEIEILIPKLVGLFNDSGK